MVQPIPRQLMPARDLLCLGYDPLWQTLDINSKSESIERLQKALNQIRGLKELSTDAPEFRKRCRNARVAIGYVFGDDSTHENKFYGVSLFPPTSAPPYDSCLTESEVLRGRAKHENERQQSFMKGLEATTSLLESIIEEIEEDWEDEDEMKVSVSPPRDERTATNRVFVVHGRDHATRDTVARLIEKLGLKALILDEQADKGRTIIEKFEQEAKEVRFAVVLLTADDEGRLRGEEADLKPRARQNVIFELGYFAGAFGRKRVCALTKGDFEIPSDYDGVVYIPLDDFEGWKSKLVKELQAAGFDVDANRAL